MRYRAEVVRVFTTNGIRVVTLDEQAIAHDSLYALNDGDVLHWVPYDDNITDNWRWALDGLNSVTVSKCGPHAVAMNADLNPSQRLNSHESKKFHCDP